MSLVKKWKDQFGENTPFLIEDLVSEDVTYDVVKSVLSRSVSQNEIKRYSQGIYYFPKYTEIGEIVPSYYEVIERKYLKDKEGIFGYISGNTLLNQLSISRQVPNTLEITTNMEKTRKRNVRLRNKEIILRKPVIDISEQSVKYLQFLDIFKYASLDSVLECKESILKFYEDNQLELSETKRYMRYYSHLVHKKIKGSGVYDEIASKKRDV